MYEIADYNTSGHDWHHQQHTLTGLTSPARTQDILVIVNRISHVVRLALLMRTFGWYRTVTWRDGLDAATICWTMVHACPADRPFTHASLVQESVETVSSCSVALDAQTPLAWIN